MMKATTIFAMILALGSISTAAPVFARDGIPQATQQILNPNDGSTLYIFKDGKMAKEDTFGRAAYLEQGEVLKLTSGRKIIAVGNEVAHLNFLLNDDRIN